MFTSNFVQFNDVKPNSFDAKPIFQEEEDLISLGWSGDHQINLFEEFEDSGYLFSTLEKEKSSISTLKLSQEKDFSQSIGDSYPQKECNHETGKGPQKVDQKKRKRRPKCPEKKKQKLLEQKEKLRMDVINKGILRMVRRFFHRLFTERNNDVVQKRFINYEFSELIERIEQLLLDIGFSDDIHNLAIFLFKTFRISTKDIVEGSSTPYQDAEVVNAAMTNYTRAKYSLVNK